MRDGVRSSASSCAGDRQALRRRRRRGRLARRRRRRRRRRAPADRRAPAAGRPDRRRRQPLAPDAGNRRLHRALSRSAAWSPPVRRSSSALVAEGEADLYPRMGTTMQWDTAAGDAILRAAGGKVVTLDGKPLAYGPSDGAGAKAFQNPWFVATGGMEPIPARIRCAGNRATVPTIARDAPNRSAAGAEICRFMLERGRLLLGSARKPLRRRIKVPRCPPVPCPTSAASKPRASTSCARSAAEFAQAGDALFDRQGLLGPAASGA